VEDEEGGEPNKPEGEKEKKEEDPEKEAKKEEAKKADEEARAKAKDDTSVQKPTAPPKGKKCKHAKSDGCPTTTDQCRKCPGCAWNGYGREFWGVIGGMVLLAPLALVAPLCWVSASVCGVHYHIVHTRSHRDPRWCQDHLRWHWDHHLGTNQDTNWGVTNQWFDCVMGTRRPWVSKQERSAVEDAPTRPARAAS
jgi:hypothetical protein